MARARSLENSVDEGDSKGAAAAAPFSTPLKLVEAAVAGDDLQSVAREASAALNCPVAIALPAFGLSASWPTSDTAAKSGTAAKTLAAVEDYAAALVSAPDRTASRDPTQAVPDRIQGVPAHAQAVPVRLGEETVGVVAAVGSPAADSDAKRWLEAAAAAAAVAALMRDSSGAGLRQARRAFLQTLEMHAPVDPDALLAQARRLGYDLSEGALAIGAALDNNDGLDLDAASALALLEDVGDQRLLALVPIAGAGDAKAKADAKSKAKADADANANANASNAERLLSQLRDARLPAIAAAPRQDPAELQDALREAAVLLELLVDPDAMLDAQEETYRLLVGVLIHNSDELRALHANTIAPLVEYDAAHDTELLATLKTFLAFHGSTSDTAASMGLHRHTVGYRLARVQEVSGLSPYESDGRERLSLGLKANRIIHADRRRTERLRPA